VVVYGPGYEGYDRQDTISAIFKKKKFEDIDLICVGHAWLVDHPNFPVAPHPNLKLSEIDIPKVMILNKEYAKLDAKLEYIVKSRINLVFTHHHAIELYTSRTGVSFVFLPFTVESRRFHDRMLPKKYDLMFTGILQNPSWSGVQGDVRVRIQNRIFFHITNIRLFKQPKYWRLKIL